MITRAEGLAAKTTVNRAVAYPPTYLFVLGGYLIAAHADRSPARPGKSKVDSNRR
ncbi:MAG TPA: hypothetical protein VNK24_10740 [Elusimicrobiota bacterium]|nr:hypothetical protein [Elusimicrobiota bacterium]